jgi:antitoxin (DNA-binding transcriptional repressor) of toxin-antitoxin stability system
MKQYSLHDAQTQLQDLIEKAVQGQQILIQGDSQTMVQLVPVLATKQPRKAGSARGLVQLADDFDAPLTDFDDYRA